ncbi:hypothetical protein B0J13DRAFT_619485 [Dactylonectria estremocensis]|uniref:Uncharacterized protein n=1 Tax=Dactylonectria estremocensis TaxID=1079267 RepID=A0A9P9F2Z0_9HYPO|nr:hypothetical protein B0J13DRAFT_619485 [Dactylonectria estremocensis]
MQLMCSLPLRVARKLRNRLRPALLKASATTQNAAASVRKSVCQSLYFHSSTDKIKHNPRPAALGTVAMLGNVKTSVATGMEAAQGKGSRLRRQMSTIYQNWEQGNALFHSNAARIN